MDKITYLAELAEGLARWVPERERQDILRYYAEYFEEAGPEREAEVVAELDWTRAVRRMPSRNSRKGLVTVSKRT